MTIPVVAIVSLIVGFIIGALVFRNNRAKIDAAEAKVRDAADALRK